MIPPSSTSEVSSRCGVITPSDAEESVCDSSVDGGGCETEVQSEAETEEEEESVKPAPVTCDLFSQAPCDWELFGKEIWEECNSIKEQGSDNKAVRYHAYKMYTCLRHGILCCFD
jgi:hypothetical protein